MTYTLVETAKLLHLPSRSQWEHMKGARWSRVGSSVRIHISVAIIS